MSMKTGGSMKHVIIGILMLVILTVLLVMCAPAGAQDSPTARVLSEQRTCGGGGHFQTYDPKTYTWSYGNSSGSCEYLTEVQIGNEIYTLLRIHKEVIIGQTYPTIPMKKRIALVVNGKVIKYRIEGVRAAQ